MKRSRRPLSNAEIVRCAIKIIGAPDCVEDVRWWVETLEMYREDISLRRTKRGKAAARRLWQALRRVDIAMRSDDLPYILVMPLSHWKLLNWIDLCDRIATRPLKGGNSEPFETKVADAACSLMRKYNKPVSTTKNSPFEKLAAVLSGYPDANFHHHCRSIAARSARTGSQ